jgi:hypothetical protein
MLRGFTFEEIRFVVRWAAFTAATGEYDGSKQYCHHH